MNREQQSLQIADHVRVVRVGLTTTFTPLAGLVLAALQADFPAGKKVIQVTAICSAAWKFRDQKNTNGYRTVALDVEKSIPAADAFNELYVASSSGTPTLEVELYLA